MHLRISTGILLMQPVISMMYETSSCDEEQRVTFLLGYLRWL
jgi:hypothetical protein